MPRCTKTLNHFYSPHRNTYKALPHTPFRKSDHDSLLLLPVYKQMLKQEVPVTRCSSDPMKQTRGYKTGSTDWDMFQDSSHTIEEFTTPLKGFINKCIDDVIPIVTIQMYPNHKNMDYRQYPRWAKG
jgi:hypothetical protein